MLGVEVRTRTSVAARGPSTDTGTAFLAVKPTDGPTDRAVLVRSIADFVAEYGDRTGNAAAYDWLDTYFREGGRRAYVAKYTTDVANGLALFGRELGPGQVAAPEETAGATTYGALLSHAAANNRFAVLDVTNDDTLAAMATSAGLIPGTNTDYGALFGPWLTVPGQAGVVGAADREVPASAAVAALAQRVDVLGNPNRAAAGREFPLQYATGFVRDFTNADADQALNDGYNLLIEHFGVMQVRGFQTAVAQDPTNPFWQANVSRARMWLAARAEAIGESYMFRNIDARGHLADALKHALEGPLLDLYAVDGLYGETPADAFTVEVGASVNTVDNVAQGVLAAVAEARFSAHTKSVQIDLVSVPVTGTVSQTA